MPVAGPRQRAEAVEQLELDAVDVEQVALAPLGTVGSGLVAQVGGQCERQRFVATVVVGGQLGQPGQPVVRTVDAQLGDHRQVVDAGDDRLDGAEVRVEEEGQVEARDGDLVAQADGAHRRLAGDRAAQRRHGVGEVEQPGVRTQLLHVARDADEHRDVAQRP